MISCLGFFSYENLYFLAPWATPGVPKDAPRLPSELPQPPSVALGASRGPPGAGDAISEHPPDPKTAILRENRVSAFCATQITKEADMRF